MSKELNEAINALYAAAINGINHVGRANYAEREHEALASVRDAVKLVDAIIAATSEARGAGEPVIVGSISKAHLKLQSEPWCKEILLYSPNNPGDSPENRVMVYAGLLWGEDADTLEEGLRTLKGK